MWGDEIPRLSFLDIFRFAIRMKFIIVNWIGTPLFITALVLYFYMLEVIY